MCAVRPSIGPAFKGTSARPSAGLTTRCSGYEARLLNSSRGSVNTSQRPLGASSPGSLPDRSAATPELRSGPSRVVRHWLRAPEPHRRRPITVQNPADAATLQHPDTRRKDALVATTRTSSHSRLPVRARLPRRVRTRSVRRRPCPRSTSGTHETHRRRRPPRREAGGSSRPSWRARGRS